MGPINRDVQVITQGFKRGKHNGVDLRCIDDKTRENLAVIATERCRVDRVGVDGYGNYFAVVVPLENTGFNELKYIHIDRPKFKGGETLNAGDVVSYCIIGGNSASLHLHFEVWDESGPIDPVEYFNVADIDFKFKGE
jgi:murein DD-endopeptidase MepM/ murein hydrolase activator NlpD